MFYNNYDIANLNANEIKSAVCYFTHNACGRAKNIGISGATATSLVNRNYLRKIGTDTEFINVGGDMYRKVEVNIYEMTCPARDLWEAYKASAERAIAQKKEMSEHYLEMAKARINEAEEYIKAVR